MKVAVGSTNPVKVSSTKQAFQAVWPNEKWTIEGVSVKSGVPDQPMSDEQSIKGATNRAKRALKTLRADFGVGLEGGIQKIGKNYFDCGWVVVVNKTGAIGVGSSAKVIVPVKMMKHIKRGVELGIACDIVFKSKNSKQENGHFGLMTKNIITRTSGYKDGIVMALVRFIHPHLFKTGGF